MKPARFILLIFFMSLHTTAFAQLAGEISLSSANATFVGENAGDQAGHHISMIGDINNDHYDDFIITAPKWDQSEDFQDNGITYLFYGRADYSGSIDLRTADAMFAGSAIGNEAAHDVFGIGDVDGDGYDDFAIGIKKYSALVEGSAEYRLGKVYIFFGSSTPYAGTISLEDAPVSLAGTNPGAEAAHVKGLGDVDDDGYDDILIGAGFHSQVGPEAGKAYLFFGKARGNWQTEATMEEAADASFLAEAAYDWAGHRVSGVGDINNDSKADFIVAAHNADSDGLVNNGKVYLFLGKEKSAWAVDTPLSEADASWIGDNQQGLGWNVADPGDVDGDGLNDILLSSEKHTHFLLLGKNVIQSADQPIAGAADVILSPPHEIDDMIGHDNHTVGDVNGDSIDDFIIGVTNFDDAVIGSEAGKSFVFWGRKNWPSNLALENADVIFTGENSYDASGFSTSGGGDVNSDGMLDLLISSVNNADNGADAGKIYLFLNTEPSLTLIQPNGGEILRAGETTAIKWLTDPEIDRVKIELSIDGGLTWDGITPDAEDSGTFTWNVPDRPTSNALVRIAGSPNTSVYDASNAVFTIIGSTLSLDREEAENMNLSDGYVIENRSGASNGQVARLVNAQTGTINYTFDLTPDEYDLFIRYIDENDGVSASRIDINGKTVAEWTWDSAVASDIAIYRHIGSFAFSANDNIEMWTQRHDSEYGRVDYFEFVKTDAAQGQIFVLSPNGGENWPIDSFQQITWTAENTGDLFDIQLSRDGGVTWEIVATGVSPVPQDAIYSFAVDNVSGPISNNCLVKVSESNAITADISDNTFRITESITPQVTLTSPNGGEVWMTGTVETITWSSQHSSGAVKIELSRNTGSTWTPLTDNTTDDGAFEWTVTIPPSSECLIRVSDVLGTASDASDAVFTIKGTPKITVTAPNGSEEWNVGSTERIRWSAEFVLGNVKIELSRDNGSTWTAIAEETINNGSYEWLVTGPDTESARARVTALNGSTSDTSDAVFTIVTPSSISILTPNGHEEWQIGSEQNITWQSVKIEDDVKIELSRDSGQTWEPITDAASNTGSLAWQVSAPASAMALIKISAGDVFDISDDFFSIIEPPEITVTAPNGGEEWTMGTKQTITWTSVNSSGAVRIEMSRDTGATWETVVDSTQDTGEYEWLVSEPASQSCLVKVSDVEKSIWDQSDTIFSIVPPLQPTITVIAPNGGERWPIGLAQKISWFSQDVNGQIKVELSRDNGLTWETLGEAAADSAVFHWTATSPASDSALIRLSANNGTVQDQSDATFVITEKTTITVNSPSGGEKWRIGSAQTISWSSINTSGTVRIQLTRDNGVNWETLTASAQDSGRYNWIVTGPASNTCLISVTDENYAAQGTSQGLFSIVERPTLSLTTPNGGEIWHIGSEGAITWESTNGGSIVKIELSRDNGSTWTQLVPDAVNIGSWTWVVQEPKSEACLIRLTDIQNVLSDKSDAVFQIDDPTGVARINSEVPTSFALLQNYPNPFNPKTRIQYQLPGRADVQLDVYNVQGTKIATLVNEAQAAGTYMLTWSGKDDFGNQMPSGVYFYRISADSYSASKRMMLMK